MARVARSSSSPAAWTPRTGVQMLYASLQLLHALLNAHKLSLLQQTMATCCVCMASGKATCKSAHMKVPVKIWLAVRLGSPDKNASITLIAHHLIPA